MKTRIAVLVLLILSFSISASAFDGKRKGFLVGGGLGEAPVARWNTDLYNMEESTKGMSYNLLLGYAWNDANMIVIERCGTGL